MTILHASSQEQLRQYIEQIERLSEEKAAITADIADKFLEAKATGFDTKIMKKVLSLRKKGKNERDEEEALLATYLHALEGTPMGDYLAKEDLAGEVERVYGIPKSVALDEIEQRP